MHVIEVVIIFNINKLLMVRSEMIVLDRVSILALQKAGAEEEKLLS